MVFCDRNCMMIGFQCELSGWLGFRCWKPSRLFRSSFSSLVPGSRSVLLLSPALSLPMTPMTITSGHQRWQWDILYPSCKLLAGFNHLLFLSHPWTSGSPMIFQEDEFGDLPPIPAPWRTQSERYLWNGGKSLGRCRNLIQRYPNTLVMLTIHALL